MDVKCCRLKGHCSNEGVKPVCVVLGYSQSSQWRISVATSRMGRRVKNDDRDATLLADLLRLGSLPEGWIAPPVLRELRELVRYRHKLSTRVGRCDRGW